MWDGDRGHDHPHLHQQRQEPPDHADPGVPLEAWLRHHGGGAPAGLPGGHSHAHWQSWWVAMPLLRIAFRLIEPLSFLRLFQTNNMAVRGAPIPLCGGVGNGLAVADEDELGNNDCVLKMNR